MNTLDFVLNELKILRKFLNQNVKGMPRVALRYSIERMTIEERNKYLSMYK